jgi:hypothetical protein
MQVLGMGLQAKIVVFERFLNIQHIFTFIVLVAKAGIILNSSELPIFTHNVCGEFLCQSDSTLSLWMENALPFISGALP